MKRSRFSEEQIIAMLKVQEAGMPTADALLPWESSFMSWRCSGFGLPLTG